MQPLLTQVVERIDELYSRDNQSEITGVPTGWVDLDRMTSGLQPSDIVIVAARPSMGKSALMANFAENASGTILTVQATDADLPAQTLTYTISGGVDAAKFAINATTGALTKIGAGRIELVGASSNLYSGVTTVSAGVLLLNNSVITRVTTPYTPRERASRATALSKSPT